MAVPVDPQVAQQLSLLDYLGGFARSSAEGIGELVGIDASRETQQWRHDNPVGGFASEMLTPLGYYGGALKIARLGKFGRAVERIGQDYSPFIGGALRESARLAPFEVGRIGVSALVGDPERTAMDAAVGMGLTAGLGGVGGLLDAAGRRIAKQWGFTDPRAPVHLQGRTLFEKLSSLSPEAQQNARETLRQWSFDIRGAEAQGGKYLSKELLAGSRDDARQINRLFRFGKGPKRSVRPVTRTRDGFQQEAELQDMWKRAGLSEDAVWWMQFPRHVKYKDEKIAQGEFRRFTRAMSRAGEDLWAAKEKDGLWVAAKRLAPDEFLVFKTDDLRKFGSLSDEYFAKKAEGWNAWLTAGELKEAQLLKDLPTAQLTKKMMDEMPLRGDLPGGKEGLAKGVANVAKWAGLGDKGELPARVGEFMREYLAPAAHRFKGNELANRAAGIAKATFDFANQQAAKLVLGDQGLGGKSFFKAMAQGLEVEGGFRSMIHALDDADMASIWKVLSKGAGQDSAEWAALTERGKGLLTALDKVDAERIGEIAKTEKLVGKEASKFLKNHFMISRTWKGDWRVPIYEGNSLVALGSGSTRKAALDEAEAIRNGAVADGKAWEVRGAPFISDKRDDLYNLRRLSRDGAALAQAGQYRDAFLREAMKPGVLANERKGVEGFIGDRSPMTKKELLDSVTAHIQQVQRYLADMSVRHNLKPVFEQLAKNDPSMGKQLQSYIDDMVGVQGTFSNIQNKLVDTVLSPALGKNSATKLVHGFNKFMFHTQLAGANIAYPMMTLLTFAQTVLPELAFVAHGAPERVGKYYTHWLAGDTAGRPQKILGVLDAWKLQLQAAKALKSPPKELETMAVRAAQEGVLDPRLIEEYIGPSAKIRISWKEALQSPDGLAKWLEQKSSFLPETTERLSRAHAFSGAYLFGKDFLGLSDDRLYNFAKQFTNRTMYLYSSAERPQLIQGPLGSAFGLFKNWQLNYLWNMMDYAGEANRGNFKPLLWGFTGSGIVGGLPAAGPMWLVADQMSRWLSDESLMEQFYGAYPRDEDGSNVSDALFLGLPAFLPTLAGLPGFGISGSASVPLSDPTRDISQLMSFAYADRMRYLGQAAGTAMEAWDHGQNPFQDPNFAGQLARALAPKTIYRMQQSLSEGVITSSSSTYPQIEVSPMEKALYIAGFNPNRVELGYRAHRELYDDREKRRAAISALGEAWAQAQQARDHDAMKQIMLRVTIEGLDFDSVMRSAKARLGKMRQDMFERNFDKAKVREFQQMGLI